MKLLEIKILGYIGNPNKWIEILKKYHKISVRVMEKK